MIMRTRNTDSRASGNSRKHRYQSAPAAADLRISACEGFQHSIAVSAGRHRLPGGEALIGVYAVMHKQLADEQRRRLYYGYIIERVFAPRFPYEKAKNPCDLPWASLGIQPNVAHYLVACYLVGTSIRMAGNPLPGGSFAYIRMVPHINGQHVAAGLKGREYRIAPSPAVGVVTWCHADEQARGAGLTQTDINWFIFTADAITGPNQGQHFNGLTKGQSQIINIPDFMCLM